MQPWETASGSALLRGLILILTGFAFTGNGIWAASLEILPVTHELTPGSSTSSMTIRNHDHQSTWLQLQVFEWTQINGEDQLTPSDDIVLSPTIFNLPSGNGQVVRLALRNKNHSEWRSYRVLIDQIPSTTDSHGVHFTLRISIPVFQTIDVTAKPDIVWRYDRISQSLVVRNIGNSYETLTNAEIHTPHDVIPLTALEIPYILPGSEMRLRVTGNKIIDPAVPLRLRAITHSGPINIPLQFLP